MGKTEATNMELIPLGAEANLFHVIIASVVKLPYTLTGSTNLAHHGSKNHSDVFPELLFQYSLLFSFFLLSLYTQGNNPL
jgi:hypothetical protein